MRIVMQANGGEMQTIKVCSIRLKLDLHLIVKSDVSHDKRFDAYKKNVHNKMFRMDGHAFLLSNLSQKKSYVVTVTNRGEQCS